MFDVLAKARTSPLLAQQLDWPKRVSMALDAAKVSAISMLIILVWLLTTGNPLHHNAANAFTLCSAAAAITKHNNGSFEGQSHSDMNGCRTITAHCLNHFHLTYAGVVNVCCHTNSVLQL